MGRDGLAQCDGCGGISGHNVMGRWSHQASVMVTCEAGEIWGLFWSALYG